MELHVLNGLSRITSDNTDSSRIYVDVKDPDYVLDGYSLNNYSLNGFTLNGEEIDMVEEYCLECQRNQVVPSLNGYMNGRKERKAKRAHKKAYREGKQTMRRERKAARRSQRGRRAEAKTRKKEYRTEKKEARDIRKAERMAERAKARLARQLARDERQARRGAMSQQALSAAEDIGRGLITQEEGQFAPSQDFLRDTYEQLPIAQQIAATGLVPEEYEEVLDEYLKDEGDEGITDTRGLLSPPPFFKDPIKWFQSKKVPTWQKGAVIVGTAFGADQLLNKGKITNQLLGKKTKAKK